MTPLPETFPWRERTHPVEQLEMAHEQAFRRVHSMFLRTEGWSPFETCALKKMHWPNLYVALEDDPERDCAMRTVGNLAITLRHKYDKVVESPAFVASQAFLHAAFNDLPARFAAMKADVLAQSMDATLQHRMAMFQPGSKHKIGGEVVALDHEESEALRHDCLQLYAPLKTWYDLAIRRSLPLNNHPVVG